MWGTAGAPRCGNVRSGWKHIPPRTQLEEGGLVPNLYQDVFQKTRRRVLTDVTHDVWRVECSSLEEVDSHFVRFNLCRQVRCVQVRRLVNYELYLSYLFINCHLY